MNDTKRGTTPFLAVRFELPRKDVQTIDFIFKQELMENDDASPVLVHKKFPDNVAYNDKIDRFIVRLTEEETRKFRENHAFYMDTRIVLTNGLIPDTDIVKLRMGNTLFDITEDEEEEEEP